MTIYDPKNARKLFIYMNPGFANAHGYYRNHADKFLQQIDGSAVALLHLAHVDLNEELAVRYHANRTFAIRPHLTLSPDAEIHEAIVSEMCSVLTDVFTREDVLKYAEICVYLYSGHPIYATAFGASLGLIGQNVNVYVNFLYNEKGLQSSTTNNPVESQLRHWGRALEDADQSGRIQLTVDCPFAVKLYEPYYSRKIRLLPAACALEIATEDRVKRRVRQFLPWRKLRVLYMGYPHHKYGYKLVKKLYERTLNDRLVYHVRHQDAHTLKDHMSDREEWLAQAKSIVHYTGFLDESEYVRLIKDCDIVVIPYLKEEYPYQTSGVFIEALSMDKVIIATEGTWFGYVVEKLGVGEVFDNNNANSLEEAMRKVVANYKMYKKSSTINGSRYRSYWSIKNLFAHLGLSEGSQQERLIADAY